jgi:hypothetical protein
MSAGRRILPWPACLHECVHACMYLCLPACVCICVRACACAPGSASATVHVPVLVHMGVCTPPCVWVRACVRTHVHNRGMHACMRAHACTCVHARLVWAVKGGAVYALIVTLSPVRGAFERTSLVCEDPLIPRGSGDK